MADIKISNIKLTGLVACVPPAIEVNRFLAFLKEGEAEKVIASTGI